MRPLALALTPPLVLALLPPAARAADGTARDPVTLAQQRLDDARTEATALSARISDAQTAQATLDAVVADAEAQIPELRPRPTHLRTQVKARAAQLYMSHGSTVRFESAMDAENAEDA